MTNLDAGEPYAGMGMIKVSSKVEEKAWRDLHTLAQESNRSISGVLTEAIDGYLRRHHLRPNVMTHLEASMNDHDTLGKRLAE